MIFAVGMLATVHWQTGRCEVAFGYGFTFLWAWHPQKESFLMQRVNAIQEMSCDLGKGNLVTFEVC